jgi:hypothetical protein
MHWSVLIQCTHGTGLNYTGRKSGASRSRRCCSGDRKSPRWIGKLTARLRYPARTAALPDPDTRPFGTEASRLPPTSLWIAQEHVAAKKNFKVMYWTAMPTYSCEGDGTSQKGSSRTRRRVTLTIESSADVVLVTNEEVTTRYRLPTPRSSH